MSASPKRPRRLGPTPIDSGAVENLRYIRSTIEAAHTFTTVPGKGCIAMGITALARGRARVHSAVLAPLARHLGRRGDHRLLLRAVVHGAEGACPRLELAARRRATLLHDAGARVSRRRHPDGGARRAASIASSSRACGCCCMAPASPRAACFRFRPCSRRGSRSWALGTATLWLPPGSAHIVLALGFGGIHLALGTTIVRHHGG